ncbi:MAG: hypothetical protein H8D56_04670, partial [Planctomycetes bacterium]|nr:hypothetical protein [Planctomycetota bacterium]
MIECVAMIGCIAVLCTFTGQSYAKEGVMVSDPIEFGGGAISRATLTPDGTIYLDNNKKSLDGGRTVVDCEPTDPNLSDILNHHRSFLNTHKLGTKWRGEASFHSQNRKRFLAIDDTLRELEPPELNKFAAKMWYSENAFDSPVSVGTATFRIPARKGEFEPGWVRDELRLHLLFYRGIVEDEDGNFLACCFGNFSTDTVVPPPGHDCGSGIQYRCFFVKSVDGGRSWDYVSTIAVPNPDLVKTQEGYDEASLAVRHTGEASRL